MPDWTYQPIFRPLLRLLAPRAGRRLILGGLGLIARTPGGSWLIEGLGHMQPPGELAFENHGRRFPSRVGIGCLVDGQLLCPEALVRLGIGALEVGPIATVPFAAAEIVQLDRAAESIAIMRGATIAGRNSQTPESSFRGRSATLRTPCGIG